MLDQTYLLQWCSVSSVGCAVSDAFSSGTIALIETMRELKALQSEMIWVKMEAGSTKCSFEQYRNSVKQGNVCAANVLRSDWRRVTDLVRARAALLQTPSRSPIDNQTFESSQNASLKYDRKVAPLNAK